MLNLAYVKIIQDLLYSSNAYFRLIIIRLSVLAHLIYLFSSNSPYQRLFCPTVSFLQHSSNTCNISLFFPFFSLFFLPAAKLHPKQITLNTAFLKHLSCFSILAVELKKNTRNFYILHLTIFFISTHLYIM